MKNDVMKFLLGEGPLDGVWFGDKHPTEKGAFWWRKHLRQFITQNQPNSGNTVLAVSGQDIKNLIFAIGYTLDAIDVRATDPRRYEAKKKAAKILEKLSAACASVAAERWQYEAYKNEDYLMIYKDGKLFDKIPRARKSSEEQP